MNQLEYQELSSYISICLSWNIVYTDLQNKQYLPRTKAAARLLLPHTDSRMVKALAGGNLNLPEDVVSVALSFESFDKRKSKKDLGGRI